MFKTSILILLTMILSASVYARSLKLTHAEFVHLTDSQKNEWVIKTMELMVELESRYEREVKTSGLSPERFKRYTQMLQKIQNLLLEPAYADTTRSWEIYGRSFASLLKDSNGSKCIYAGWVSRVLKSSGKEYCVHPHYLGTSASESRAYAKGTSCEGRNKITCNPAVFGFKSEGEQSLFCVNAGVNEAHNSSYNCMKEALAEAENSGRDSREVRLRNLRNRLSQHPAVFEEVQKFIFQTCLCESTPGKINQRYHEYMRPHRTCYGLMEMLGATACEEPKIDFDTTFFTKLREFTNGKIITSNSPNEVDSIYTNYLNEIRGSSKEEYARLCPNDGIQIGADKPETTPETRVPGQTVADVPTLPEVKVTPGTAVYSCKQALCKAAGATPQATPAEETPSAAPPTEEETPATEETPTTETPTTTTYTCDFEFLSTVDGVESAVTPTSKPTEVPKSSTDTTLAVKATFGDKTEDLSCSVSFGDAIPEVADEATEGLRPTIKLSLKTKTVATQKVVAEVENREGYTVKWHRKGYPDDKDKKPEAKPKPKAGMAGDSGSEEAEDEPAEETQREEEPTIAGSDDKLEIEEPLKAKTYETCAKLVAEGKPSSDESCVTIPKVSTPAAKPQQMGGQPQQQMMPRGGSNTSALGIR